MSVLEKESTEKKKEKKTNLTEILGFHQAPDERFDALEDSPQVSNKHIFTLPLIQQFKDIYRCFFHFPGELPLSQPIPHLFCCHQHLPGPCFLQNKLELCHGQDLSDGSSWGIPTWGQFHTL